MPIRPEKRQRACDHCGQMFEPYRGRRDVRFCAEICKKRAAYLVANPKVEKVCRCGTVFWPKSNKRLYCSKKCCSELSTLRAKTIPARVERVRQYRRRYSKTPQYRLAQINHKARRRSVQRVGSVTYEQWEALLNRFDHRCAYCRQPRKLTQDHVLPLSRGGEHHISNIVPACQPCNSAKCDRDWSDRLCQ